MMSTMSMMSAPIVVADLIEENAQLKARVAEFEVQMKRVDALRNEIGKVLRVMDVAHRVESGECELSLNEPGEGPPLESSWTAWRS